MAWLWLLLYQLVATLGFILAIPYLVWRSIRYPGEMGERLGWIAPDGPNPRPVWIHGASLGELEAVRALCELDPVLARAQITVLSVSARRTSVGAGARDSTAASSVRFIPLDIWFALPRFLGRLDPRTVLVVETEIWPLLLALCQTRSIPTVLVSARISDRNWKKLGRLRWFFRPFLEAVTAVGAQTPRDAERFRSLGARDVRVTGNLKYRLPAGSSEPLYEDRPDGEDRSTGSDSAFLWVAGSVRRGEESVLDAAVRVGTRKGDRACHLVLAPRHLREMDFWRRACESRNLRIVSRSQSALRVDRPRSVSDRARIRREVLEEIRSDTQGAAISPKEGQVTVLLVDRHGELTTWYALADAAFIGGTLVPIGGHNVFEAARESLPIAVGPFHAGVQDAVDRLDSRGALTRVLGTADLTSWVQTMSSDRGPCQEKGRAALHAARDLAGAGERTLEFLRSLPDVLVDSGSERDA